MRAEVSEAKIISGSPAIRERDASSY